MKDAEFIELLNLYLDHEISAADAARLEAEVQRNPERRQVYRQYCQMHKACSLIASDFAAEPAEKKVIEFQPRRASWAPALWSVAGLAAAACFAFVLLNRAPEVTPTPGQDVAAVTPPYIPPVVEPQTPPPASDERAIARTVTVPMRRGELQPVLTAGSLAFGGNQNVAATSVDFDWMKNVKLTPLQVQVSTNGADLLRLESKQPLKATPAVFRSGAPMQEMSAFQFQK